MKHFSIILTFLLLQTYSFSQTLAWDRGFSEEGGFTCNAIENGNIYRITITEPAHHYFTWILQKLDNSGSVIYSDTIGTFKSVIPTSIAVVNDAVYIAADLHPLSNFMGYSGLSCAFVKVVNRTISWIKEIPGLHAANIQYDTKFQTLMINGVCNTDSVEEYDGWNYQAGGLLGKFDLNGNCNWIKNIGDTKSSYDAATFNGESVLSIKNSAFKHGLCKVDDDGNVVWQILYPPVRIALDTLGNIYLTGQAYANSPIFQENYFISKLSPSGSDVWWINSNYGGAGKAIYVSPSGEVYAGGTYGNNAREGMGIEKYTSNGDEIWHFQLPRDSIFIADAEYLHAENGEVFIGGWFNAQGSRKMIMKLYERNVTTSVEEISETTQLSVFPNPTTSIFTFNYKNDKSNEPVLVSVKSISGQVIYSQEFKPLSNTVRQTISIGRQAKGTYLIQVSQGEITETKKLVFE